MEFYICFLCFDVSPLSNF